MATVYATFFRRLTECRVISLILSYLIYVSYRTSHKQLTQTTIIKFNLSEKTAPSLVYPNYLDLCAPNAQASRMVLQGRAKEYEALSRRALARMPETV